MVGGRIVGGLGRGIEDPKALGRARLQANRRGESDATPDPISFQIPAENQADLDAAFIIYLLSIFLGIFQEKMRRKRMGNG